MSDNLDIETAVYRDFKAYFENPGTGLTAIPNIKNLYSQVSKNNILGTYIGIPFSQPEITSQKKATNVTGYYRTTVNVICRTSVVKDKNSASIRSKALAVRNLMNRENIQNTLTNISTDQTYFTVMQGPAQPGNNGKIRTFEFSFTVLHKVSK